MSRPTTLGIVRTGAALAASVIVALAGTTALAGTVEDLRGKVAGLQRENRRLRAENERLKQQAARLRGDAAKGASADEPALARKRKTLINQFVARGIISKTSKRTQHARLWVTARFRALSYDEKSVVAGLVHAYYFGADGRGGMTLLVDDRTGKIIGDYGRGPYRRPLELR